MNLWCQWNSQSSSNIIGLPWKNDPLERKYMNWQYFKGNRYLQQPVDFSGGQTVYFRHLFSLPEIGQLSMYFWNWWCIPHAAVIWTGLIWGIYLAFNDYTLYSYSVSRNDNFFPITHMSKNQEKKFGTQKEFLTLPPNQFEIALYVNFQSCSILMFYRLKWP